MGGPIRGRSRAIWMANLESTLSLPFSKVGDAICLGNRKEALRHARHFGLDLTGLEAFVNHLHIRDVTPEWAHANRLWMMAVAHAIALTWSARLKPLLGSEPGLFFLGGRSPAEISLRFHVER